MRRLSYSLKFNKICDYASTILPWTIFCGPLLLFVVKKLFELFVGFEVLYVVKKLFEIFVRFEIWVLNFIFLWEDKLLDI